MELLLGIDMPLYLVLLPLAVLLVYVYGTWPFGQWKSMGIDGPPPEPFFGNQRQMTNKGNCYALWEWSEKYGRTYGIYQHRKPLLVTSDLDILKEVLVKDFGHFTDRYVAQATLSSKEMTSAVFFATGADWKRIRSIITPTFSGGKLKLMEHFINRCAMDLAENLKEIAEHRSKVDVKQYFGAFTFDVIAGTAFGLQVNSQQNLQEPFLLNIQKMLSGSHIRPLMTIVLSMPFLMPVIQLLARLSGRFNKQSPMKFFIDNIHRMVDERKQEQNDKRPTDFLQLLINAEASDDGGSGDPTTVTNKRLSKVEIVGQAILFFIAGYETTATTLQYMSYNLAKYPELQERVFQEIQQELGDEKPTYENVGKLKHLEHFIYETLRMFPAVSMVTRMASETVTIKGVTIPKGFGVVIPICDVLCDPEYFPEPEKFMPERWETINRSEVKFLSFGFGPRLCIGMRLALLEIKVAMVHVLRTVKFNKTPDLPEKIRFKSVSGLIPPVSPILIEAELRQDTAQSSDGKLSNGI